MVHRAEDRFENWSNKYESGLVWHLFFRPLHWRLARKISPQPGEKILDTGCGTGALARRLAEKGAVVCGLDSSPAMLEETRHRLEDVPSLWFVEGTAEKLPFEEQEFDTVISVIAFHHFLDPVASLKEALRVLKPGGRVLICDMSRTGPFSRPFLGIVHRLMKETHQHGPEDDYYTRRELRRFADEAGFAGVRVSRFTISVLPPLINWLSGYKEQFFTTSP